MVWMYWLRLGLVPSAQTQLYSRVSYRNVLVSCCCGGNDPASTR